MFGVMVDGIQPATGRKGTKTLPGMTTSPTAIMTMVMVEGGLKISPSSRGIYLGFTRSGSSVPENASKDSGGGEKQRTKCCRQW